MILNRDDGFEKSVMNVLGLYGVIVCKDGIITKSLELYRTLIEMGYGNKTLSRLHETLRRIDSSMKI